MVEFLKLNCLPEIDPIADNDDLLLICLTKLLQLVAAQFKGLGLANILPADFRFLLAALLS